MATNTKRNNIRTSTLWLSLASGPLLWAVYYTSANALASLACQRGFWTRPILGPVSGLTLVIFGFTIAILLLMAFAGSRAFKNWIDLSESERSSRRYPEKSHRGFIAFSALILNVLFGIGTLVTFLANLAFTPCS